MGERVDTDRRGPSQLHPFEGAGYVMRYGKYFHWH